MPLLPTCLLDTMIGSSKFLFTVHVVCYLLFYTMFPVSKISVCFLDAWKWMFQNLKLLFINVCLTIVVRLRCSLKWIGH